MSDNRTNEPTPEQVEAALAAHDAHKGAWVDEFREMVCPECGWCYMTEHERRPGNKPSNEVVYGRVDTHRMRAALEAAARAAQGAAPAHPVIDREALIHAIAARHWDEDSGEVENWDGLTTSEKQNVIDNYLCPRVADAVIAHLSAAPQAEAYDHCCNHPKCPGGSLCCCASEQRLRDCWNQWLSEFDADARQAFRDGYQAGQNDPAPWMAPVLPSSGVDEDKLAEVRREAAEKAWWEACLRIADGESNLDIADTYQKQNPYLEGIRNE